MDYSVFLGNGKPSKKRESTQIQTLCDLELSMEPEAKRAKVGVDRASEDARLPPDHQRLLVVFGALDSVVHTFRDRRQLPTFDKLRQPVANLSQRSVGVEDVGRVLALCPGIFSVEWASCVAANRTHGHNGSHVERVQQLVVRVPADALSSSVRFASLREALHAHERQRTVGAVAGPHTFASALPPKPQTVRLSAAAALASAAAAAAPPLPAEGTAAPAAPTPSAATATAAAASAAPAVQGNGVSSSSSSSSPPAAAAPAPKQVRKELRGLPLSLLANLRKKTEQRESREAAQRDAGELATAALHRSLPALSELLYGYFRQQRRGCLALQQVVRHATSSGTTLMSAAEAEERVRAIAKLVPEWCTVAKGMEGKWLLRLDQQSDFPAVRRKLVAATQGALQKQRKQL